MVLRVDGLPGPELLEQIGRTIDASQIRGIAAG